MKEKKPAATRRGGHIDLSDRVLFATLLAISYPLCLMVAVSHRLTGILGHKAMETTQGVFAEAKSAAHAAVGYAFHA